MWFECVNTFLFKDWFCMGEREDRYVHVNASPYEGQKSQVAL